MTDTHPRTKQKASPDFHIYEGYRAGLIGWITAMHAETYHRFAGFGLAFESKVASELADFAQRLDRPVNGIWRAEAQDRVIASIAIDGEDLGEGQAHLRWFIVDPTWRSAGIGKLLLAKALGFVDQQSYEQTQLWTLKGLSAAQHLYEQAGFRLANEYLGDQWGEPITEQMFIRPNDLQHSH